MAATWLKQAVFYEIYPQSFYDTNADGIGDINGITEKLDYIRDLGCNAIWINPCFDSPFKDAGYDVRDYKMVAPRYGTNSDLYRLFHEAHARGMHVVLDLVAGHTSEEHAWFKESSRPEENDYSSRYVWTDYWIRGAGGLPYIAGETERNGAYVLNFFKCQPALNYGFLNPSENWQQGIDEAGPRATREALKDIMRFWLDHGCDGFRVDMAASLVKNDDDAHSGTCAIWKEIREMLDQDYPEAAMISEWCDPVQALPAGFDMDFYLDQPWNGYHTLMRDYLDGEDHSYFKKDSDGDIRRFLEQYQAWYDKTCGKGYISLITCNHDTLRPRYSLSGQELKLAYAFIFTMPGVPFLYYGDEIGMRYLPLPTKEGGYTRTGSRTPMQWHEGKNLGFSEGEPDSLYLPVDPAADAPTVEKQAAQPHSLLNTVKSLLALRARYEDLQADGSFSVVSAKSGSPFVYRRGRLLAAVNPSGQARDLRGCGEGYNVIYAIGGCTASEAGLSLSPQSFAVLEKA